MQLFTYPCSPPNYACHGRKPLKPPDSYLPSRSSNNTRAAEALSLVEVVALCQLLPQDPGTTLPKITL